MHFAPFRFCLHLQSSETPRLKIRAYFWKSSIFTFFIFTLWRRSYKLTFFFFAFAFAFAFPSLSQYIIYFSKFMHETYVINLKTYSRFSDRIFLPEFRIFPDFFRISEFFQNFKSSHLHISEICLFSGFPDFPRFFRIFLDIARFL